MSGATVKKRKASEVEARVRSGLCLIAKCDSKATRRGLCMRHYQLFRRRMQERGGKQKQAEFEAIAIEEGKILPVQQVRAIMRNDPFAEIQT